MPNDSVMDTARKTLKGAQAFTASAAAQGGYVPPQAHAVGVAFANAHGNDHRGYAPSADANDIGSGLAWRAQQVQG